MDKFKYHGSAFRVTSDDLKKAGASKFYMVGSKSDTKVNEITRNKLIKEGYTKDQANKMI